MTMPVIAIIVATICRIECKEIRKQTNKKMKQKPDDSVSLSKQEDFMKAASSNPITSVHGGSIVEGSVLTRNHILMRQPGGEYKSCSHSNQGLMILV